MEKRGKGSVTRATEISALIRSIMLLPAGAAIDSTRAQLCLIHIERRGYQLVGIVHDWATALVKVRARDAEVVVLAGPEDFNPDWMPRIEYCGDETQELARYGYLRHHNEPPGDSGDVRHRRPGPVS